MKIQKIVILLFLFISPMIYSESPKADKTAITRAVKDSFDECKYSLNIIFSNNTSNIIGLYNALEKSGLILVERPAIN